VKQVDLATMNKEDRDKIYEQAKVREFPLLFVDNVFIGNYEAVMDFEEYGELNAKIL